MGKLNSIFGVFILLAAVTSCSVEETPTWSEECQEMAENFCKAYMPCMTELGKTGLSYGFSQIKESVANEKDCINLVNRKCDRVRLEECAYKEWHTCVSSLTCSQMVDVIHSNDYSAGYCPQLKDCSMSLGWNWTLSY